MYYAYPYPYVWENRQIGQVMGCLNKWVRISFTDGTVLTAYPTSFDFSYVGGYVPHSSYRTLTCQGEVIRNKQQAQKCLKKWVQITLPNQIVLSFYLVHYDDNLIGGYFSTNSLLALSNRVSGISC